MSSLIQQFEYTGKKLLELRPDLVPIPSELFPDVYEVIYNGENVHSPYEFYSSWVAPASVIKFVRDNIFPDESYQVQVQLLKNGIHPHYDTHRSEAYNFLLNAGDYRALNVFYRGINSEELIITETHSVPEGVWYWMDVKAIHNVINFWKPRVAITIAQFNNVL